MWLRSGESMETSDLKKKRELLRLESHEGTKKPPGEWWILKVVPKEKVVVDS